MPTVNFVLYDGSRRPIEGEVGTPVMYLARKHELPGILAECGGVCSCATCHVHVDPEWMEKLPPMEEDELDIIEFAEDVDEYSRLSCQIKLSEELDGLVVHVPEFQY